MTSAIYIQMLIAAGFGYLLGSIPFGLLLTRAAGLGDVRSIGSGNIGATNVLRTGNKKLAAATLFLDGFKGFAAVVLVGLLAPAVWVWFNPNVPIESWPSARVAQSVSVSRMMIAAGLGAFLGHIFPVWLGFRGGKGVATYIGVLFGLVIEYGFAFCALWLVVAFATRYSSLAALLAAALIPVAAIASGAQTLATVFAAMTALLFWTHRENIRRLLNGTESKIGAKTAKPANSAS